MNRKIYQEVHPNQLAKLALKELTKTLQIKACYNKSFRNIGAKSLINKLKHESSVTTHKGLPNERISFKKSFG